MSQLQSFEEFELALKYEKVPEVNCERVINNILLLDKKRVRFDYVIKRVKLLTVASIIVVMFIVVTGLISGEHLLWNNESVNSKVEIKDKPNNFNNENSWILNKDNESMRLQYFELPLSSEHSEHDFHEKKVSHMINYKYTEKLTREAKPGEAIWYVNVEAYELGDNHHYMIIKPLTFNDIDSLSKATSTKFKFPLLKGFDFTYGKIEYLPEQVSEEEYYSYLEELYQEAKRNGDISITKVGKATDVAKSINTTFFNNDNARLDVTITRNSGYKGSWTSKPRQLDFQIITIGNREVLYSEKYMEYIFVHEMNKEPLVYTIKVDTSKMAEKKKFHKEILQMIKDM